MIINDCFFIENALILIKHIKRKTNKDNNELFFELWNSINNDKSDFNQQAAALSILCYMFEICEVFEK